MENLYLYIFILICFIVSVSYFNTYMSSYIEPVKPLREMGLSVTSS